MEWKPFEEGNIKGVGRKCADSIHELVVYKDKEKDNEYIMFMRETDKNPESYNISTSQKSPEDAYDHLYVGSPNEICEYWDDFFNSGHDEDKASMLEALAKI